MGRRKARKTISAELSVSGINRIINELHEYRVNINKANERFVQRLMEEGFEIATASIYESLPTIDRDKPIGNLEIISDERGEITSCALQFTGEQVLFIEFGAGIRYNEGNNNPLASQFGYGVGTYPQQTHAFDRKGWNYYGNDNHFHHSYGTKATMPMYNASQEIRKRLIEIAKEVYQGVI